MVNGLQAILGIYKVVTGVLELTKEHGLADPSGPEAVAAISGKIASDLDKILENGKVDACDIPFVIKLIKDASELIKFDFKSSMEELLDASPEEISSICEAFKNEFSLGDKIREKHIEQIIADTLAIAGHAASLYRTCKEIS